MAISTQRSLAQLQTECRKLGLTVKQSTGRVSKTDYILALRQYYIEQNYLNGLPKSLELMLQIESPMLCKRYPELKPEQQEEIWASKNWVLQEKLDGNRMPYMFVRDEYGKMMFDSYSRNISVKDYLPESYGEKIYMDFVDMSKITDEFILDSEVISSNPNINTILERRTGVICETQLQSTTALLAMNAADSLTLQKDDPLDFWTFDCIWYNGVWLLDKPLVERLGYLKKAIEQLEAAGFRVKKVASCYKGDRRKFYKDIIASGGEGCVAKDLRSLYVASNNRTAGFWVKIKRTMTEAMQEAGLADSIDGWISGFEPADEEKGQAGLVGSIDVSVTIRRDDGTTYEHVIARVSNLPLEMKREMTEIVDGKPQLKAEFYGKCCTVDGQAISARVKALRHAVFKCWRPDRSADTCIIDESFLNSQIL